ncbi:MAG TPA: hypothetical protein EYN66_18185 [Myxococcales bacterium]|nr:hypothetical protein [Myxococcales bacterium]
MALSLSPIVADTGTIYATQTDATSAIDPLKASAGVLYKVEINNADNPSPVFVKLFNSANPLAVTVGTTAPEWVFKCPASVTRVYSAPKGSAFSAGLLACCVTTPGTGGTANPTNDVVYRILLG